MNARVVNVAVKSGWWREVTITISTDPVPQPRADVRDLPQDMRQALIEWLKGAES